MRILISAFILLAFLSIVVFLLSCRSPEYYITKRPSPLINKIIPFADYSKYNSHIQPYILRGNTFTIFGSVHTRDPKHFELKLIEMEWNRLKPTIALVEGRLEFEIRGFMDPVKTSGEGGLVRRMASKSDVPIYNWDLSKEELATRLLKKYRAEQIAVAQILNPYFGQVRFGKPSSPEKFIEKYIKRAAYVGLEDSIRTATDVEKIWKKYFTDLKWQDIDDNYPLPGYLGEMAIMTNDLRNKQLISAIDELIARGERVFLLCGSSHAFCANPVFEESVVVEVEELIQHQWNDPDALNNLAWNYFKNKDSPDDLNKAMNWIKRSIELKSTYENNDTYAWLLFKKGMRREALEQARKAIEIAKGSGRKYDGTEELLKTLEDK